MSHHLIRPIKKPTETPEPTDIVSVILVSNREVAEGKRTNWKQNKNKIILHNNVDNSLKKIELYLKAEGNN